MSKIKLKPTYGGYKTVAQVGGQIVPLDTEKQRQLLMSQNIKPVDQMTIPQYVPPAPAPAMDATQAPQISEGAQQGVNTVMNVANAGFSAYNKFQETKGRLAYGISQGIAGLSAIAGMFDETQLRRRENEQKIQSLQGTPYENTNRGTNNIPAYTKYGGDLQKMKTGGTAKVREYQKMLNEKFGTNLAVDGAWGKNTQAAYEKYIASQENQSKGEIWNPLNRERRDLTNYVEKPHSPKLPKDAQEIFDREQYRNNPYSIVSKADENIYNFDSYGNLILKDEVGLGKDRGDFAAVAFQKGYETTPAGEYRIKAKPGAVPMDKKRKGYDADNYFEIEHTDPELRVKGSPTNPKYAQVTQAIHGIPDHLLGQRLPALNNPNISNRMSSGCINCKKETLNSKYFNELDEENYRMFVTPEPKKRQYGGGKGTNVEAEGGEVFDNGGDILKIKDGAATHEEGGVDIYADRVLENTSTQRKDAMSKALKLSKDQVSTMSGFKAKRPMSHSDAYEFEAKKTSEMQEKILKAINKTVQSKTLDKYAIEAANLNVELGLAKIPSENVIFDKYFDSQETIKEDMGFYDGKVEAKYGKAQEGVDNTNPYKKGKTKTPTGKNSNFPGNKEDWMGYKGIWEDNLGKSYSDDYGGVYDLQYDAYTWSLENDPGAIRNMWKEYGLNKKAEQNGVKYDTTNLTDDQLLALRNEYVDGLSGARMLQPAFDNSRIGPIDPLKPRQAPGLTVAPQATPGIVAPTTPPATPSASPLVQAAKKVQGEFNQPLEWYDTIGPNMQILNALRRDPELYNPVNIADVKLQQQDVRPALNNSQAEYNAAIEGTGNDSIGAAQRAQMFSNKLRSDNQTIGQYENANKSTQNQETQYNASARDRQEMANAQSRESFYTKVLQGRAKQEEQLLTGIDALAKTYAENRAFNRNANLLMKLAPNFNEKAEYNGVPASMQSNGPNQPGFATVNGKPQVNEKGQYLLRTKTKDGKVSEEYVDRAYYDKMTNTASTSAIQNDIIRNMVGARGRR